jgi:hypothetical protein
LQPDWVGIGIGLVIAILSFIGAYRIGKHSRKTPRFGVAVGRSGFAPPRTWGGGHLSLTYRGETVESVSQTHIAFWNDSGDPIRRSDISEKDPLRIVIDGSGRALSMAIVSMSRSQIDLKLNELGVLSFDYLEPGDGGIVEVLHDGQGAAKLEGTIIGARRRKEVSAALGKYDRRAMRTARLRRVGLLNRVGRRRFVVSLVGALSMVGVAAIATTGIVFWMTARPILVQPENFDLSSLDGQLEFAREVLNGSPASGTTVFLLFVLLAMGIGGAAVMIRVLMRMTAAVVPTSLAAVDLDPLEGSEE